MVVWEVGAVAMVELVGVAMAAAVKVERNLR